MTEFLTLDPNKDLEFKRPFTTVVKQSLYVVNTHPTSPIAFKVKTTAPKTYCVRPNSGRIGPNSKSEVVVLLQAMKEDPPLDFKCKDKFLVQAIKIPTDLMESSEPSSRLSELWSQAEQLKKSDADAAQEIMCEKKLKCSYLPADSDATGASVVVPSDTNVAPHVAHFSSSPTKESTSAPAEGDSKELREAKEAIKRLTVACDGYKQEIDRLNSLRQRKGEKEPERPRGGLQQSTVRASSSGMQMQMVALVALISFILGVLLF